MRKTFCCILLFLFSGMAANAQRAWLSGIIGSVSKDSLLLRVRQLSGDTSIVLNGNTDTIRSRYATDPGNEKAAQFIKQELQRFGLSTFEQAFPVNGKNIYAVQQGTLFSKQCYMICAHYDNLPALPVNYGSDDNASGVAAVLEAARLLSRQSLPYTVYYALFDQEEQGLLGSDHFCNMHDIGAQPVLGVINMDMIAYDGNHDSVANIHIRPVGGDAMVSNRLIAVNALYHTGLNLRVIDPGSTQSDHASFWKYFMPAVMFIEDDLHDFNPGYHSVNDRISLFDTAYYHRMASLAIGTLADLASDSSHVGIPEYVLAGGTEMLYPNPVSDRTVFISHVHAEQVRLQLIAANGATVYEDTVMPVDETVTLSLPPAVTPGLYQVIMHSEAGTVCRRLLKQ